MTDCLFVYGTLMRAAARSSLGYEQRRWLAAAGEWLGAATISGRLYDRGSYPALVGSPPVPVGGKAPVEAVLGEVYRLADPDAAFGYLDPYEGITDGGTRGAEYERVIRPVQLQMGELIDAWVYLCIADVGTLPPVNGGRWLPKQPGA